MNVHVQLPSFRLLSTVAGKFLPAQPFGFYLINLLAVVSLATSEMRWNARRSRRFARTCRPPTPSTAFSPAAAPGEGALPEGHYRQERMLEADSYGSWAKEEWQTGDLRNVVPVRVVAVIVRCSELGGDLKSGLLHLCNGYCTMYRA